MTAKPVAAGKSSADLVDLDTVFSHLVREGDAAYLDLASGAGRYTLPLAERVGNGRTIHALDLWEEGIHSLREEARRLDRSGIRARVADATQPLPLPDGAVDACLMATMLHDLPAASRDGVAAEVARVLAPGGRLVLIEFKKLDHGPGPPVDKRIDATQAEGVFRPHGLRRDVREDLGEFTYLVRFVKD